VTELTARQPSKATSNMADTHDNRLGEEEEDEEEEIDDAVSWSD
jgi:hypothetical protein